MSVVLQQYSGNQLLIIHAMIIFHTWNSPYSKQVILKLLIARWVRASQLWGLGSNPRVLRVSFKALMRISLDDRGPELALQGLQQTRGFEVGSGCWTGSCPSVFPPMVVPTQKAEMGSALRAPDSGNICTGCSLLDRCMIIFPLFIHPYGLWWIAIQLYQCEDPPVKAALLK